MGGNVRAPRKPTYVIFRCLGCRVEMRVRTRGRGRQCCPECAKARIGKTNKPEPCMSAAEVDAYLREAVQRESMPKWMKT